MKNTTSVLKEANKYLILQCIISNQPISIEGIMRITAISYPTVLEIVKNLIEEKYILKEGQKTSTGGRPAKLLIFNENSFYAVGIDFEFPAARIALSNGAKRILASDYITFPFDAKPDFIIEQLIHSTECMLENSKIERERLAGIGIGLPGTIDEPNGISIQIERIINWTNIPVQTIFEKHFHVPVYIKNDVHFMAIAERERNGASRQDHMIYIGIRSGIGSAIIYNGTELKGSRGNAGNIGHTIINPNGPVCSCGKKGCLEAFAGELAMNQKWKDVFKNSENTLHYMRTKDFIAEAGCGNQTCVDILNTSGQYLGLTIANLIETLEISNVIIGGCDEMANSALITSIRQSVSSYLTPVKAPECVIQSGRLKEEDYPLGACCYVLSKVFQKPKLLLHV